MKERWLLPSGFKKIGWAIFVPTLLMGIGICFFSTDFGLPVPEAVYNNIAIIGSVVGGLFIGFSREKCEDEMIQRIRLDSLLVAMWINYLALIAVSLLCYDLTYLTVLSCGMVTPLVIFLVVYHLSLYRLKRASRHEE